MRQLYLSSYHLSPVNIPYYLEEIKNNRIRYLWGYSSALYTLAVGALENKVEDLNLSVVITNAEPLYDFQREVITKAFGCPVRETYGMAEIVTAASECEHGRLHLWPEVGYLEVFDLKEDVSLPVGEFGRFVATGLLNTDQPLIRYEIGDTGALAQHNVNCSCNRSLPILQSIEGRTDDVLVTIDGRRIGRLDPVFKVGLNIVEAQIIQETLERIRVIVIPSNGYSKEDEKKLIGQI